MGTALAAMAALGAADSNFTVTAEAVFDVEVKNYNGRDDLKGKITVGIFGNTAPVSALNFKTLCNGFKRPKLEKIGYKNTQCHRIVKDMLLHCGDVFNQEGRGSTSIYGATFNDENFIISHTSGAARFLDKKHVAFGKVTKGFQYVMANNRVGPDARAVRPKKPVKITNCEVQDVKNYDLSLKDMKTDDLEGIVVLS